MPRKIYTRSGADVLEAGKKIGTVVDKLLVLTEEESDLEWDAIEQYVLTNAVQNGKVPRELGFHHSYEIIDGQVYRIDHSMLPRALYPTLAYNERGYLGQGGFGNTKKGTTRTGTEVAIKIEAMGRAEYDDYLLYPGMNEEQQKAADMDELIGANVVETKTSSLWRPDHASPPVAKRHTILKLAAGEELFQIGLDHYNRAKVITNDQRYLIAFLVAKAYERRFKSGNLHRDHKPENVRVDLKKMRAKDIDFGFTITLPDALPGQKAELRLPDIVGSPNYVAPEILFQTNGQSIYSEASEVFAFGEVLHFLVERIVNPTESLVRTRYNADMQDLTTLSNKALQLKRQNGTFMSGEALYEDYINNRITAPVLIDSLVAASSLRPTFSEISAELKLILGNRFTTAIQTASANALTLVGDAQANKWAEVAELHNGWDYQKKAEFYVRASTSAVDNRLKEKYLKKAIKSYVRAAQESSLDRDVSASINYFKQAIALDPEFVNHHIYDAAINEIIYSETSKAKRFEHSTPLKFQERQADIALFTQLLRDIEQEKFAAENPAHHEKEIIQVIELKEEIVPLRIQVEEETIVLVEEEDVVVPLTIKFEEEITELSIENQVALGELVRQVTALTLGERALAQVMLPALNEVEKIKKTQLTIREVYENTHSIDEMLKQAVRLNLPKLNFRQIAQWIKKAEQGKGSVVIQKLKELEIKIKAYNEGAPRADTATALKDDKQVVLGELLLQITNLNAEQRQALEELLPALREIEQESLKASQAAIKEAYETTHSVDEMLKQAALLHQPKLDFGVTSKWIKDAERGKGGVAAQKVTELRTKIEEYNDPERRRDKYGW